MHSSIIKIVYLAHPSTATGTSPCSVSVTKVSLGKLFGKFTISPAAAGPRGRGSSRRYSMSGRRSTSRGSTPRPAVLLYLCPCMYECGVTRVAKQLGGKGAKKYCVHMVMDRLNCEQFIHVVKETAKQFMPVTKADKQFI